MEMKEVVAKYGINIAKGILPGPIAAIIDTINECSSENELKSKFDQLKHYSEEYAKILRNTLPTIPISVEVEYASVVVLYYLIEPQNINVFLDIEEFQKQLEIILEEGMGSMEDYEICSEYIVLQSEIPISKSDWQDGPIQIFKEILNEEFNIKIKSILYI